MKIEHLEDFDMKKAFKKYITCKKCGNITQLKAMSHENTCATIKKLNNDEILVLSTGEIIEATHIENRSQNKLQVSQTLRRLRDYINTNVTDATKCKWVTLTYKENMTDTEQLYNDFERYIKKFRYSYKDYKIEYIVAMEPQARGAWHCHCIFIFDKIPPFIPNEKMQELWGHGFTKTQKLNGVDNVGAYLTAYLGDIEYTEENVNECLEMGLKDIVFKEINDKRQKKKFIKGGRLYLYPAKFNIYRCSRGIKKPFIYHDTYDHIKTKEGLGQPSYKKTIKIITNDFENIISYEEYNKNRK